MKNFSMQSKDPIIKMTQSSLLNLPTPYSISLLWNMGFLLGLTLMLQILTGLVLSMNYVGHTDMAFDSVIHIMRDLTSGWSMRYFHMNGASLFFILLYSHIGRGMVYNSPEKLPMVWASGVLILLTTMGTAFMGYVLPWGQMSFWGATVITSMLSAIPYIGKSIMLWLWGNFSVSQPTLNRFFSLHFILPLFVVALALSHLIFLHVTGSSNPLNMNPNYDKMKFFPYFTLKDMSTLLPISLLLTVMVCMSPNELGDVENFNKASIATTPPHIQPEWYFLFAYAILRAIPSKLGGVVAMLASILVLMVLCVKKSNNNNKFSPKKKLVSTILLFTTCMLTWIGANPVEDPFTLMGVMLTVFYFSCFIFL